MPSGSPAKIQLDGSLLGVEMDKRALTSASSGRRSELWVNILAKVARNTRAAAQPDHPTHVPAFGAGGVAVMVPVDDHRQFGYGGHAVPREPEYDPRHNPYEVPDRRKASQVDAMGRWGTKAQLELRPRACIRPPRRSVRAPSRRRPVRAAARAPSRDDDGPAAPLASSPAVAA